ncbi:MAG TPA: hypothetical protein VFK02_25200 [Kofleriaceae bacterium]|nr:hypothetical protein [Kofleriaceae bacterium]
MTMKRWGWLWMVAMWTACAPVVPSLPSQGGAAWVEIKSDHFTLWTDASPARGRQLVDDLERRRQIITAAMGQASSGATAFVIALRNSRERAAFMPLEFVGKAWNAYNITGQPGIFIAADQNDRDHVISHEMSHVVSFGVLPLQPAWLAEGIATYFEMVDVGEGDTSVKIDRHHAVDLAQGCPRDGRRAPRGLARAAAGRVRARREP